jgi:hypothetical protein
LLDIQGKIPYTLVAKKRVLINRRDHTHLYG